MYRLIVMEILERVRRSVGCGFISDLRFGANNKYAKTALKSICISDFSLCEVSDAVNYIYGNDIKFKTVDDVKIFLGKQ